MNLSLFEEHSHWPEVLKAYETLTLYNYKCYLVGGCVRDLLLGNSPKDFDLSTDASAEAMKKIFKETINIGETFGTIMLARKDTRGENFTIEITRFRFDESYRDGRRPEKVSFLGEKEDALRRDFTINALFYDLETEKIIDYVGGQADLQNQIIRAVGQAYKRFSEDHLRILRALRFAAQLDFQIERQTLSAALNLAPLILELSKERIQKELSKFFAADFLSKSLHQMQITGILEILFTEFYFTDEFWCDYKSFMTQKEEFSFECSVAAWVSLSSRGQEELRFDQVTQLKEYFPNKFIKSVQVFTDLIFKLQSQEFNLEMFHQLEKKEVRSFLGLMRPFLNSNHQRILKDFVRHFYLATQESFKLPEAFLKPLDIKEKGVIGEKIGQLYEKIYVMQICSKISSQKEALACLEKNLT